MAYVTGSHALKVGMTTRSGVYNVTGTFDPPYALHVQQPDADLGAGVRVAPLQREPAEDEHGHLRAGSMDASTG